MLYRYPFAVSKTGLVACGSPHAWPPLLASLAWFVELLLVRTMWSFHKVVFI